MARLPANKALNGAQMVDVLCTDNGKTNKAELISRKSDMILVEFVNGLRLTLHKYPTQPGLFVGNNSGLEFQCKLGWLHAVRYIVLLIPIILESCAESQCELSPQLIPPHKYMTPSDSYPLQGGVEVIVSCHI